MTVIPTNLSVYRRDGSNITITWKSKVTRDYTWNVYVDLVGTPPIGGPPIASGLKNTQCNIDLAEIPGNDPPTNDVYVVITGVNNGVESAQSDILTLNIYERGDEAGGGPDYTYIAMAPDGSPRLLSTDAEGALRTLITSDTGTATEAKQDIQITQLNTLISQTADVATETTLATLGTEATLATLGTEATLATLATEATVATLGTEATLATLATEATVATLGTEATLATLGTEATLATLGTEATLATLGTEATLATLATEATLSAADTKLGTIAGDTTSLDTKVPSQGQALMAASLPVAIASDQSEISVGDLLTSANAPQAIPVTNTNVALPAVPLTGRKMIAFLNTGNTDVLLGIGGSNAFPLSPGQPLSIGASAAVLFSAIRPVGSGNVVIWEFA